MELFDAIPASLFTILTSKNRDTYATALLTLRKSFAQDVMIEKEALVALLANSMQANLLDIDPSAEEEYSEENIKDANALARFLVKRFKDTGWIDMEYARGSRLQEFVTLPPYSIKMLDLLNSLCSEEIAEYDAFMYSMYSSLISADDEYKDYRYTAINNVYDKIIAFESTLKGLFTDLKRHYIRMTRLKTVNQMLYEHFDSYQKDIIKQIYLPLKTKDSISRFKGPIMNILSKWLRSGEIMDEITTQAMVQHRFNNRSDASEDIINKVNFITDKLLSLQELLVSIDARNNLYVQTATDKMRYLLKNDKSIKGKITKITEKLSQERLNNVAEGINLLQDYFYLNSQGYLEENSLFNRSAGERNIGTGEIMELQYFDDNTAQQLVDDFADTIKSRYSHNSIIRFMHEQMDELDVLNSKDINIADMNTLIMVMYAFIKGFDTHVFYRLELLEGNIVNHDYSIPDMNFVRRKEL